MSDDTDIGNEFEQVDLREFTLRIPGENFSQKPSIFQRTLLVSQWRWRKAIVRLKIMF